MSKITQLNDKAIAVEWAKGATKARIDTSGYLLFEMPEPGINGEYYYDDWEPLEGSWSILGKGNELTEGQWKGILEQQRGGGMFKHYDIEGSSLAQYGSYMLNTATESGISLLKSKGLNPDTSLILIKQ